MAIERLKGTFTFAPEQEDLEALFYVAEELPPFPAYMLLEEVEKNVLVNKDSLDRLVPGFSGLVREVVRVGLFPYTPVANGRDGIFIPDASV